MLTPRRQGVTPGAVRARGRVRAAALIGLPGVADMTVRRDLDTPATRGLAGRSTTARPDKTDALVTDDHLARARQEPAGRAAGLVVAGVGR